MCVCERERERWRVGSTQVLTTFMSHNMSPQITHLKKELFGHKHFDFCPLGFVLPKDSPAFLKYAATQPGQTWIVKPASAACGRGIYVTRDLDVRDKLLQ